jgi:N-formylglutamate amidohydrolase
VVGKLCWFGMNIWVPILCTYFQRFVVDLNRDD